MPEGNIIHRVARVHGRWLSGRRFTADSPQGRFGDGARVLSGRVLQAVEAHGKHLFYRFEGEVRLHVHLGLFGNIRHFRSDAPAPSPACRLRLSSPHATLHLSGPQACELLTAKDEATLRAKLGEDPLRPESSPERAREKLCRGRMPLALALLDQERLSGVGNILRAEALFLARLPPLLPAGVLSEADFARLWDVLQRLLLDASRDGHIVTPGAPPVPEGVAGRKRAERFCVYGREGQPCPRCGAKVRRRELAARGLFFCAECQGVDAVPRPRVAKKKKARVVQVKRRDSRRGAVKGRRARSTAR
ncbi:DNA glycosylase [Myxococcus sp. K38C18041901]|uniref:Fpg/Nei family DNA glycosylase n=1 Tax=Myxococcus guangdongensis TaxID=2906760 RepID=UPI0020A824F8|nr:DNA-formamidopyrimidine glycosylase family protein [Myxococcus guangdongensis]MCP3064239.1 DNA glycosylase [Myxococcus guangdongensis]